MLGKLFGKVGERPAADPNALPVPRGRRNGTYPVRALGDTRVLALVEAADAGDWDGGRRRWPCSTSAGTTRCSVSWQIWTGCRTGSAGPPSRMRSTGRRRC